MRFFCFAGTLASPAFGQEPLAPARIRETVAIETDLTAQRQLELARVHLAEKRWKEGIDLVRQAAANSPASLVSVGPGRYLNVELYAQLLFSSLPPEGLAVIRQAVDGSARQTFEEALRNRDADGLRSIVRDAFASRATEDSLLTLGQWAWESGEITQRAGNWERLIPLRRPTKPGALAPILRSPDSHLDRAGILARLVMCRIVEGDFDRSGAERNAFRRMYPKATGQLAGKSGNLADRLDQIDGQRAKLVVSAARQDGHDLRGECGQKRSSTGGNRCRRLAVGDRFARGSFHAREHRNASVRSRSADDFSRRPR